MGCGSSNTIKPQIDREAQKQKLIKWFEAEMEAVERPDGGYKCLI